MTKRGSQLFGIVFCQLILVVPVCQAEDVDYLRDIKPLLKNKCWACHGPLQQESGLRLDAGMLIQRGGDSGPAAVPGNVAASLLLERVAAQDPIERMPPEGEPLTHKQIALLRDWIASGARFPDDEQPQPDPRQHWSFQPLRPVTVPASSQPHPIDAFVERRLHENGLDFGPQADSRTLVRRLFLDMHGLPPDWDTVQKYSQTPNSKTWESLIDQVLASPRYGERWAQHWLDVVRYADTHGYEVNTPRPHAWPYRDFVIEAFNSDRPYDQFIREQLAGDQLGRDAATGFLVAAAVLLPGQIGKDEASIRLARQDALDEIIVGTSATFLGLTLGCARCHDHKFDPLSQADYYAMQAFFSGVDYGDRPIRDEKFAQRLKQAEGLEAEIATLRRQLRHFEPYAFVGHTVLIDDEDLDHVQLLREKNGHGQNPAGTSRGYADDPGTVDRMPNLSGGRYTWWDNVPQADVLAYRPQIEGRYAVWLSWGAHGSGVHTRDARYLLDDDGDLATKDDQTEIAQIDQYYVEGQTTGETERSPLWSGLRPAGVHQFSKSTRLIVRGGETGTGITADVVVFQAWEAEHPQSKLPRFRAAVNFARNLERFPAILASAVRFTSRATTNDDRYEPCLDELEVFAANSGENVALSSNAAVVTSSGNYSETGRHQLKHVNDGLYGNDHSWISNEKGRGWVQITFEEPVEIDRVAWGRDRTGQYQDRLPVDYQIDVLTPNGQWHQVADSHDRLPFGTPTEDALSRLRHLPSDEVVQAQQLAEQLQALEQRKTKLQTPQLVYAGIFREPDKTYMLQRGDPEQPQELVAPAVPQIFSSDIRNVELINDPQRRMALADWIASPHNPLTARVMVNRIWQGHFGTGLVETPSDFGLNGGTPSHPQLLDWLANEFIRSGWSVKHLHRLILTSRTWQQSNSLNSLAQKIDGDCRLFWRFPSRRLEAEAIRDSLLFVSGQLNFKAGGPGFDFFQTRGGLNGFPPVTQFDAEGRRRMVYAHKIRMERVPIFGAFDCPDAGQPSPTRSHSTTAIQALNLFNSPFVAELSRTFAKQVSDETQPTATDEQVTQVFRTMFARNPMPDELLLVKPVVNQHGLATLIRVLFNSNEFLVLP